MEERVKWWNTLPGQAMMALAFGGAAFVLVPQVIDRLPIPTDSVAWAILPWVLIALFWIVLVRQVGRFRSRNTNGSGAGLHGK